MKEKMKGLWTEFKKFISRGNVVDMAIGVVIGTAFTAIVNAVTKGILMPLVNWAVVAATGGQGLEGLRTVLGDPVIDSTTGAIDWAATSYIDWGTFINSIIDFLLIALLLFTILKIFTSLRTASNGLTGEEAKKRREMIKQFRKEEGMSFKEASEKADAAIAEAKKAEEEAKAAAEAAEAAKPKVDEETLRVLSEIRDMLQKEKQGKESK